MNRSEARAHAMELVYEWEMGGDGGEDTRTGLLEVQPGENEADFMERVFAGVIENAKALDECISKYLRGWTIGRLARVELAILRVGAYELLHGDVPDSVVVNEAVKLAVTYSEEKAGSFINGVLGSISRQKRA